MAFNCTITVNAGRMPNAQGDFVWLATAANFPLAAIDGGVSSILNGGGNLRCYTDDTKATRLPIEVVSFVTGGSPSIQVWGLSPSLNVASTVYIEADEVETSQPAFGAAFGRNATWINDKKAYHLLESAGSVAVDSTGNTDGTYNGNLPTLGANFGQDFDGNVDFVQVGNEAIDFSAFTFSAKIKTDTLSGNHQIYAQDKSYYPQVRTLQWRLSGDKIEIICWDSGDNIFIHTSGSISLSAGVEYIVTFSFDGANYKTYINGVIDLNIANTTLIRNLQSLGPVIGANSTSSEEWNGEIGHLVDRNGAFKSDDFILSEHNNQSDPAAFWSTSAWTDSSGGGLTALTKSFTAQFDFIERKSKSFTAAVALLARVNKNYQGLMNFLSTNQVNKAFSFELDLLQQQQTQVQLVADLLSRDSSAFSGQLDLLQGFTKSHSSLFDLLSRQSKSFTSALALLQRENKSYQGLTSFLSANQVNKAFSFQFDLLAHKVLTHSGIVNFLGHEQLNFSAVLDLLNRQSKSFSGELDFYQQVNKSFIYQFDSLATGSASKSFSFELDFIGRLTKQYNSEITLLQRQGLSHQLSLDLLDRVAKDFSAQVDLHNTQSKNFTVTLDTIGRVGKTFDVVFNIQSDDTPKTPAHYVISVEHIIEFIDPPIQTIEFIDNPIQILIV
jgi:hypothetical protein